MTSARSLFVAVAFILILVAVVYSIDSSKENHAMSSNSSSSESESQSNLKRVVAPMSTVIRSPKPNRIQKEMMTGIPRTITDFAGPMNNAQ